MSFGGPPPIPTLKQIIEPDITGYALRSKTILPLAGSYCTGPPFILMLNTDVPNVPDPTVVWIAAGPNLAVPPYSDPNAGGRHGGYIFEAIVLSLPDPVFSSTFTQDWGFAGSPPVPPIRWWQSFKSRYILVPPLSNAGNTLLDRVRVHADVDLLYDIIDPDGYYFQTSPWNYYGSPMMSLDGQIIILTAHDTIGGGYYIDVFEATH